MEKTILNILKNNEQRDYKKGGVSIPPENYSKIVREIILRICKDNQ